MKPGRMIDIGTPGRKILALNLTVTLHEASVSTVEAAIVITSDVVVLALSQKNRYEPLNHKHSKYEKTYCLPWTEFERFRALFPLVLASSPEFCLSLLIPLSFPDPSSLESISMGTAST